MTASGVMPNAAGDQFGVHGVCAVCMHSARQFLDIGSGLLPTVDNTHEVAQRAVSDARIVYVDHDPVVLVYARRC